MTFNKVQVLAKMQQTGLIPVFYHHDIQVSKNVLKACYNGGIRVFEFTNRAAFAHEVFGALTKYAAVECPDMILGVGSVVDAPTAALYIQLGASFIVSPMLNPEIAKVANRRLIPYAPGCATVTEIGMAQELGCDLCKVFPGDVLGANFVKGIKAPMPWTNVMVTGGVKPTEENLKAWFDAGVTCVGMASNLFPAEIIKSANWAQITRLCSDSLHMILSVRA